MPESEIPLTRVVDGLRREMLSAMEAGKGGGLRFEVRDVELEMQVVVTKAATGELASGGGLKFWVLQASAQGKVGGKYEASQIQKVKLRLRPKMDEAKKDGSKKDGKRKRATVDLAG